MILMWSCPSQETKGDDDGMAASLTKAMPASMASMLSLTKVVSIPKSMMIPASMVSGSVPDQGDVDPEVDGDLVGVHGDWIGTTTDRGGLGVLPTWERSDQN
ncbi:unnamed protein product [Urochloa humidicola]